MSDTARTGAGAPGGAAGGGVREQAEAVAGQVREQAGALAGQLREQAGAAAGQLRDQAGAAAGRVGEEASHAVEDLKAEGAAVAQAAQDRARGLAEEGKRVGAEQAQGWARALHRAADSLEEGGSAPIARAVHQAADSVEGLARGLRDSSPGQLMAQVQDLARRQPVAVFGAAVLAGFALARFAKSSAAEAAGRSPAVGGYPMGSPGGMRAIGGGTVTPRPAAMGAPGWVPGGGRSGDDAAAAARPATMAAASLGGAAARPAGAPATEPMRMPGPDATAPGTATGGGAA